MADTTLAFANSWTAVLEPEPKQEPAAMTIMRHRIPTMTITPPNSQERQGGSDQDLDIEKNDTPGVDAERLSCRILPPVEEKWKHFIAVIVVFFVVAGVSALLLCIKRKGDAATGTHTAANATEKL